VKAFSVKWKEITEGIPMHGPLNDHLRVGAQDPEHPEFLTCIEISKKLRMKQEGNMLTHAMAHMDKGVNMRRISGFDQPMRTAHMLRPVKHPGQCKSALVHVSTLWFADWYTPTLPHKGKRRVNKLHHPRCICEHCLNRRSGATHIHNAGLHILATGISRDMLNQTVIERLLVMQPCTRLVLGQRKGGKLITWDGKNLTMESITNLGDCLVAFF
jgi:hypothetical protein